MSTQISKQIELQIQVRIDETFKPRICRDFHLLEKNDFNPISRKWLLLADPIVKLWTIWTIWVKYKVVKGIVL
jgi:hypothetical protein